MKKQISLLSFFMAAVLVLSAFSPISIFAQTNESDQLTFRSGLLKAVGINVDETAIGVKRSEFICYIADAFALSELTFSGQLPYTDISSKDSFYQAAGVLYDLGVLSASDKFNPNVNIAPAEAAKIIVSAMGYDYIAQAKGGYPTGYLSLANSMDIGINSGDAIDGKMMVDILYETLSAVPNYASVADKLPDKSDKNGFLVYHNITEIEGVVTSNNITSIYSYIDVTDGEKITLDGKAYAFESAITDGERTIDNCLGAYIRAYVYDYDGQNEKIIFFDSSDNNFVSVSAADADKNGFVITVTDASSEKNYRLSSGYSVILNGKLCDDFTDADFETTDGKLLLVDNNGDRNYDVVYAENPEYIIVDSFNSQSGYISDKNKHTYGMGNTKIINLTQNDVVYEYFMYISGTLTPCTAEDLESFKSFELVMSRDEKYIRLTGFSNTIAGEVGEISDTEITIEGTSYKETAYSKEHNVYVPFGSYLTAFLTADGKLIYLDADEKSLSYGFLMKIAHEGGMGGYRAALLQSSGVKQTVKFGKKVTLDSVSVAADFANTSSPVYTKLFDKPQLIKYSINKDGEFSVIDTFENTTDYEALTSTNAAKDPENSLLKYTDITNLKMRTASYTTCFAPHLVPRTVKLFTVPKILATASAHTYQFNMDDFNTINIEEYPDGENQVEVYDIARNRDAGAMVIYADVEAGSLPPLGSRSANAVIDRIVDSINDDGARVKKVTYIVPGEGDKEVEFVTAQFTSDLQKEYERRGYELKPGDYVYVARSGEEIGNMIPIVYYNTWTVNSELGLDVKCSDYLTLDFCAKGVLVDFSDAVISVLVDDDDPSDGYDNRRIVAFPTSGMQNLVRFNPQSGCFDKIGINDLKTVYNSDVDSADRVVIRSGYLEIFGIALYSANN